MLEIETFIRYLDWLIDRNTRIEAELKAVAA